MPDRTAPPSRPASVGGPDDGAQRWPGERLGLPEKGPRSVARLGRRVAGLAVDWAIAYAVAALFFGGEGLAITGVFLLMQMLFLVLFGGSLGHLALGMRLVPMAGGRIGVGRPLLRSVLLVLVIPAVVWDLDQRGLHDRVAGTLLVRV